MIFLNKANVRLATEKGRRQKAASVSYSAGGSLAEYGEDQNLGVVWSRLTEVDTR